MSGSQTPTTLQQQSKGLGGLLTVLQTDLRTISQEARTKFPLIKEASERAILLLKIIEDEQSSTPDKLIQSLSKSEDILKPFLLACETKNSKMISIAIGSILKLISQSAVSIKTLPLILVKLTMLIDVGSEEQVQLKVLQGLLILITTLNEIHDDLLAQCLVLCFRLHSSKNSSIQHTSSATLPQIIRIIFDKARHELDQSMDDESLESLSIINNSNNTSPSIQSFDGDNENNEGNDNNTTESDQKDNNNNEQPTTKLSSNTNSPPINGKSSTSSTNLMVDHQSDKSGAPNTLKPCARDAYLLLEDLCHITGGDNPSWLPPTTTISRSSGLELIDMIISVHQKLFFNLEEFKFLLKDRVCPLLIKSFKFKMDFYHTVRLMKIITTFISKYSSIMVTESDVLLTKTIRMLESDNQVWMQILALESFRTYAEDPSLLRMFYRNYDKDNNAAKIFENLSSSIGKYVQNLYHLDSSHYVMVSTTKNRSMDLLNRDEPPITKDNYIISVCTECITGIVNAVSGINNPELNAAESEMYPQMANSCWVSILGAISMLLSKAQDEALIQIVLKSLQSFTNTCGELHLSAPRDALLTCLCKTTMPSSLTQYDQNQSLSSSKGGDKDKDKDEGGDEKDQGGFGGPTMLTIKNILSLKTLLNIAHCMGSVLDETWLLVLETLETWDRLLKTMNQSLQQDDRLPPSVVNSPRIGQGEVSILITAMNSLFKSSNQLDERSISYLFDALGKLCTNSLSKSSFVNSPTNLFSIARLVEASMTNLSRIDKLWPLLSQHLIETANFKNSYVRAYGIESLTQIIKTALTLPPVPTDDNGDSLTLSEYEDANIEYSPTSSSVKRYRRWSIEQMQVEFFVTIEEITYSSFSDTKEKILESIHQILSASGHILSTSWPILLSILLRVAQNNEKQFIGIAFESLKLICNEFLSNLSPECLVMTIEVICAFVSQKSDINISLTASSGLLSDLTYFLANENAMATSKFNINETTTTELKEDYLLPPKIPTRVRPTIPTSSPYYVEKDRSLMSRMWLCAFSSMKVLCIDQRPAIRNGVIVSLFQTLTTFLHLLDKELIDLILWRILFPLIEEVKLCSDQADKERIDSDLGGGVMLLVHHSRNTAQKQWDETQVLPIGRMIIVFKTFFDTLISLPSFNKAWEKLLSILESESKSTSKEVSMASISSLHEIVNSSITDVSHPEIVESVWETLLRLATKLTDPTNTVPKSLSIYIKVFLDLYSKTKSTIDTNQLLRVLQIVYPLGLYLGDSTSSELSNPQVHTLQLLKSFPPISEEIFPVLITMILKYISIGINYQYVPTNTTIVFPPHQPTKELVYYSPITEKSMDLICELFLHSTTTNSMRASIYEDVLKVIGASMLTKYTKYHSNVWKISVSSLIKLLPLGLLSINEDTVNLNDIKRNIIWTELIDSIQTFILHERSPNNNTLSPEKKSEEDRYDIELINAISKEMVGFSGIKVERVSIIRDRLVEILNEGSALYSVGREKVSQACYQNMFSICSKATPENPESIEIAKVILPVILKRCREVLQHFVVDEKQTGQFPLSRARLAEVSFILREIRDLQLQPGIYQSTNVTSKCHDLGGSRPHLLELFGIISDCICTSEKEIKELLRSIFSIIGQEFLQIS